MKHYNQAAAKLRGALQALSSMRCASVVSLEDCINGNDDPALDEAELDLVASIWRQVLCE